MSLIQSEQDDKEVLRAEDEAIAEADKPKIEERKVIQTVRGPVRIVTRIMEKPIPVPGRSLGRRQLKERIIERVEERGQVVSNRESDRKETPSAPSFRSERFLLGAGISRLSGGRPVDSLLLGYSFRNRLDLAYQLGLNGGPGRHSLLAVLRF